jgi:peptidoglycan L-alanyl-D-glutamate endopeptidase CwlK
MASRNISDAHPILQTQFSIAKPAFERDHTGVEVFLTCSYRSPQEQTALYNQPFDHKDNDGDGKVDEGDEKVTQAKAGQSPHNYLPSFAIDVAFKVNSKLDWSSKWFSSFSKYMSTTTIEWGGVWKFKDTPHYEVKNWNKK